MNERISAGTEQMSINFCYGKRKRLINCDEILDMFQLKRVDYVSDVMKCIVQRVREYDTALIDMRVPPENENC